MDVLPFNVLHGTFYLISIQEVPEFKRFFHHICKRIELINEDDEVVPYLMCKDEKLLNERTPLSIAIENDDIIIVTSILDLLIKAEK